jgi:hypothetical protein
MTVSSGGLVSVLSFDQIVTRPTYEPLISRIQNPFGNAKG